MEPAPQDTIDETEVDRIVAAGPYGTLAVSTAAILALLAIWFSFYFLVFLPRGSVG